MPIYTHTNNINYFIVSHILIIIGIIVFQSFLDLIGEIMYLIVFILYIFNDKVEHVSYLYYLFIFLVL